MNFFKSKALKQIESLHPVKDAWKIVQLTLFYEFPWDYNRALELALYKTFAVPSISEILMQSGQFTNFAQKRYDDTDLLLSEIIENGMSPKGLEAIAHMNWIHSNYKISNEDYLYVLSTFIFDSARWINTYGYRQLTKNEEIAGFYVWLEIGEQMHIKHIPPTIQAFKKYHDEYERDHFLFDEKNKKLAIATENLMLSWYLPKYLYDFFRPVLHAVMEPHLLKAFDFKEPHHLMQYATTQVLKTRSSIAALFPRNEPLLRTKEPHRYYKNGYQLYDIGPDKLKKTCPYHAVKEQVSKLAVNL